MVDERSTVIEDLMALGMSSYEAKAYLALVTAGEQLSGYEVAKRSGVPRSTVYETLGKLIARGAAFEARTTDRGADYVALPAGALIRRLRRDMAHNIEALSDSLPRVTEPGRHLTYSLADRGAVLGRASDVLDGSRREILVHAWESELAPVFGVLAEAEQRGVSVFLHRADDRDREPEGDDEHPGSRLFAVVGDHRGAVVARGEGRSLSGLFSNEPALCLLAGEAVRRGLMLDEVAGQVGEAEPRRPLTDDAVVARLPSAVGPSAPSQGRLRRSR